MSRGRWLGRRAVSRRRDGVGRGVSEERAPSGAHPSADWPIPPPFAGRIASATSPAKWRVARARSPPRPVSLAYVKSVCIAGSVSLSVHVCHCAPAGITSWVVSEDPQRVLRIDI